MVFLSVIALLLCINSCDPEYKNKGRFAKDIPKCIKQSIEKERVIRADEYCVPNGMKKIYHFILEDVMLHGELVSWPPQMYDENCNFLFIQTEEFTWIPSPHIDNLVFGYLLPDGTIEYEDVIYRFKRVVFTQKSKK